MEKTILQIAGLEIRMQTEDPLRINSSFLPFLSDEEIEMQGTGKTYQAVFRQTDRLDLPAAEGLLDTRDFSLYEESPGCYVRFYRDGTAGSFYAMSRFDPENRTVQVQYLPEAKKNISETGNSFFHIEWENLLIRERKMILHAACIDDPEMGGILFSGPSGVGKSTQADLWCRYKDAGLLNGDRTILGREETGWTAYGSPYAGSSKCYVNACCRVAAVVLLRQASVCGIRRMGLSEAFRAVYAGLTVNNWDSHFVDRICDLTGKLIADVPVYELFCTPDRKAVEVLYSELQKEHGNAE